jgi:NTP pyrophosphatase (non-canonical NTP hydrolase)
MDFDSYQDRSKRFDIFPGDCQYHLNGVIEELGEIAKFFVRAKRDARPIDLLALKDEFGDALWYLTQLIADMDLTLDEVADSNIRKLTGRSQRNAIKGDGHDR